MDNIQSGQMLGPYRIISELGRGGMSIVYKAYHPTMDRYVGIKVLIHQYANDEGFRGRFRQEVRLLSKLEHSHILAVYDCGETPDETPEGMPANAPYLVMRYLEGGTLKEYMETQMPPAMREGQASGAVTTRVPGLPLEVTDQFFTQLADALQYAHEQGIIHRDIKPGNVLVDRRGNVFLTDFGIAKLMEGSVQFTPSGAITGTPAYMSPEQAEGEKLDPRSDVYSLAIVLYEMLTGRVPFEAETPVTALQKKLSEPLPSPRAVNAEISPLMETVLYKALTKSPDDRFSSMREFSIAWKQAVSTKPGSSPGTATQPGMAAPPTEQSITADKTLVKQLGVWEPAEAKAPAPSSPSPQSQRTPTPPPYNRPMSPPTRVTPPPVQQDLSQPYQERKSKIPVWGWLVGLVIFLCVVVVGVSGLLVVNKLLGPQIQTGKTVTAEVQPTGTVITLLQATTVTPPLASSQPLATLQAIITPVELSARITPQVTPTGVTSSGAEPTATTGVEPTVTTPGANAGGEMLLFGPKNGSWEHQANTETQLLPAGLNESNFTAQVTFTNPYNTAVGIWDAGFVFRGTGKNNGYGLVIRGNKTWELIECSNKSDCSTGLFTDKKENVLSKGNIGSMDDSAGKPNKVVLLVLEDIGFLYINNYFSGLFDLSQKTSADDVMIGTAFYKESNKVNGFQTNYQDFRVWKMPAVHEASEGELITGDDTKLKTDMADLNLKNFIAKATFTNPYIASKGLWNAGFVFRSQDINDQFRVYIQSDSLLKFGNKLSNQTYTSWLSQNKQAGLLKLRVEATNELMLVVWGEKSLFLVNGKLATQPDLTVRMDSGDIGVGTGFLENDQIAGQAIKYSGFTIWELP
ncbi:MAG: serine/threonine protein kinase [Anaerolineales bacterium]|nr:serine/threonine protein kinase [Anaerolineales bacterium]